jgi:hypothetical protein
VKDLWLFYSSDRIIRKESKGFVETIQELIQNIDHLMILLNSRESAELILETTELLVNKCDKIYLVVLFYLDFVHAELLSIQRGTSTEVSRQELFDKAKNSILKMELALSMQCILTLVVILVLLTIFCKRGLRGLET